jgi:hypothetical protein
MVPQSGNKTGHYDVERQFIEGEAKEVATRHQIDLQRVLAIIERCADSGWLLPGGDLDGAIAAMGKSKALTFFENEDLHRLAARVYLVNYFNHYTIVPLCSLDELAQLAEDFISYLSENRTHLLKTGHTRAEFDPCPWLNWHLAKLFHFDFPTGSPPPPKGERKRLRAGRGKLLNLKLNTLKILGQATKCQTSTNLWEDSFHLLTEAISSEEAEFYLRMDHFYMGYDIRDKVHPEEFFVDIPGPDRPGALTDLLEVIRHFEEELTLGSFAKTRSILGNLVKIDEYKRPSLLIKNYFEAIEHPSKAVLDSALDLFSSFEPERHEFLENYRYRVKHALENDFYEEIPNEKVTYKSSHLFKTQTRTPSGLINLPLEATGEFPRVSISEGEDTKTQDRYVFRQEGQIWTTIYNGITKRFEDAKGFHYIVHLLSNRGKEIGVLELVAAVEKQTDQLSGSIYSKMTAEQLEELNLTLSHLNDGGEIIDNESEIAYSHRLDELREEYEVNISNPEKAAEIKEELNFIEKELSAAKGLGGRTRKFPTLKGTTQKAVSKAIFRTLGIIKKNHPDLYSHLNNALRPISPPFCYNPDRQINWITE